MAPAAASRVRQFGQLLRFYQAAVMNAIFGFGTYALMVRLGLNPFVAQIISQISGVTFNYITYSRHVFRAAGSAKARFIGAYAFNYILNVVFLALFIRIIRSPYLAGFVSTMCAAFINYAVLKYVVFVDRPAPQ